MIPRTSLVSLMLLAATLALGQDAPRSFSFRADLTGDGAAEQIDLTIHGRDVRSPFKWDVSVKSSDGNRIHMASRDDAWLDEFFSDDGYIGGCSTYESCKRRYYFTWLPNIIETCLRPAEKAFLDAKWKEDRLDQTVRDYLKTSTTPVQLQAVIQEMSATLRKSGYSTLCIPISGVEDEPPMIWVKSIQRFVPFYHP